MVVYDSYGAICTYAAGVTTPLIDDAYHNKNPLTDSDGFVYGKWDMSQDAGANAFYDGTTETMQILRLL